MLLNQHIILLLNSDETQKMKIFYVSILFIVLIK